MRFDARDSLAVDMRPSVYEKLTVISIAIPQLALPVERRPASQSTDSLRTASEMLVIIGCRLTDKTGPSVAITLRLAGALTLEIAA